MWIICEFDVDKGAEGLDTEVKKRERPEWYTKTVRRFYNYPAEKKRLEILSLRLEAQFPSQTAQYGLGAGYSGGTSDHTGGCVSKRCEIELDIWRLSQRIREVEIAINSLGTEERQLIDLRYLNKHSRDWFVARQMQIPLRSYYRVRDELIVDAAVMFGYCTKDQVSFEEMGWKDG